MIRLLLAILIALSLAGTSGPAFAGLAHECPMEKMSSDMNMDQDRMGCCTPGCAVACAPAVLPGIEAALSDEPTAALPNAARQAPSVRAFNPAAIDPPPRSRA